MKDQKTLQLNEKFEVTDHDLQNLAQDWVFNSTYHSANATSYATGFKTALQYARNHAQTISEGKDREVKRLQSELFKANIELSNMQMKIEKIENRQGREIDLIRSALAIAEREGVDTNWEGFKNQCAEILIKSL